MGTVGDLTIYLINIPSPGASYFCQIPYLPLWGKGKAFDLVVKIQHLDDSTDANVPTPWIMFLCHYPFQGRYISPTGGGGAYY